MQAINALNRFLLKDKSDFGNCNLSFLDVSGETTRFSLAYKYPARKFRSSARQDFYKYPRTRHLYNLGAATKDDKIFTEKELATFLGPKAGQRLVVQEKVDGGNMGISIDPATLELRAQNRSRYVTPRSHPQYEKLWFWLNSNQESLWNILTAHGSLPAGQLIMYGEWLAMKHSIHYTRLPNTFLAFDILEIPSMRFYSFSRLLELLQGTGIRSVPIIADKVMMTSKELLQMVGKESNFYDGPVEGIYIRLDSKDYLLDRAKIVRPDFTSGNEEWDKGRLTANVIVH